MRRSTVTICWLTLALAVACGGCLKVNTRIVLQPDGSALVTERVQFSRALLDLGSESGGEMDVAKLLTRKAVEARMKHMGEGVTIVSHKVRDLETNARESVTVFKVAYLDGFKYASPFAAYADYAENSTVRCRFRPLYKSGSYVGTAGEMAVSFHTLTRARAHAKPTKDKPRPKSPSPKAVQILRHLRPVFADMLKNFELRLTFETYGPIHRTGFGLRGGRAGVNFADVIHFTDRDLDRFGGGFLENEEIALELLQGRIEGPNITKTVEQFPGNTTVPVFVTFGSSHRKWYPSDIICFAPARPLFEKHFAGKKLDYSRWAATPPAKQVTAKFEKIGYQPKTKPGTKKRN